MAEGCGSLTLSFSATAEQPGMGGHTEVSELRFLADGRRLLHRNGLDVSDFVVAPAFDKRGRLAEEIYQQKKDAVAVLRIDLDRGPDGRVKREALYLVTGGSDLSLSPSEWLLGWYAYEWDAAGRLAKLEFFVTGALDSSSSGAGGRVDHRVVLHYAGASRNPHEAEIFPAFPGLDSNGSPQPWTRLHFRYDQAGRLLGAREDSGLRMDVRGASCEPLPERLWPIVLNPLAGAWRPVVLNPTQEQPPYVPSLPR